MTAGLTMLADAIEKATGYAPRPRWLRAMIRFRNRQLLAWLWWSTVS